MQVLIDVDLPGFPLEEFEPIAFRRPSLGELIWSEVEKKMELAGNGHLPYPWLILRRRFNWNASCPWLKCRFLTWGFNSVFGFNAAPYRDEGGWHGEPVFFGDPAVVQIQFPGGDPDSRIEENPNWGK